MEQAHFVKRRADFMQKMSKDSVAIIPTAQTMPRSRDVEFPFRPDSNFYYLTGFPEKEAIAVLMPNSSVDEYSLFNLPASPEQEVWEGRRIGQANACEDYQADAAFSIEEFEHELPSLLKDKSTLYYTLGHNDSIDKMILTCVNQLRTQTRNGIDAPIDIVDVSSLIEEMRLIKGAEEILLLKKAAAISVEAHLRAMKACRPGMKEYQLEAELVYEFTRCGARAAAYPSIVAGGENACTLHYTENTAELKAGELVLIDAGCEFNYYASDITRTFPINGKFTKEQEAVYEIVLATQTACIDAIKPGIHCREGQELAISMITQGLMDLGILKGEHQSLVETEAYKPFYMHGVSHWLGLDVHDAGNYKTQGQWRELQENMVFTVEPGIYISPSEHVDERWWNIGIRIEDDVVVTNQGCDVLSGALPKVANDIVQILK